MKDEWKDVSSKTLSKEEFDTTSECYRSALKTSFLGAIPGYIFGYAFSKKKKKKKKN